MKRLIKKQSGGSNPDDDEKVWLENWYNKRKIQDDYIQGALDLDKPNIKKRFGKFKNYEYVDKIENGNAKGLDNTGVAGQFQPKQDRIVIKKGLNDKGETKLHELNHYVTYDDKGDYLTSVHQDIVNNEILPKEERQGIYKNDYFQDPREIHSRIMVLRKDAGFKPDVPVTKEDLDKYLKSKETVNEKGEKYYDLPNNVKDIFHNAKDDNAVLNMLNYMAMNKSKSNPTKAQVGLQNKPDNELMELFEAFAQSANDDDFKNGQDVYKEFIKLNPEQQKQFLSSIQNQAPQDEEDEYNEQMQMGGIPETANGYYELNPYENPIAKIPSNKITMKGLKYKIRAVGGSGKDYGEMLPDQEYSFPDEEYMYEIPKVQSGGRSPRRAETKKEKEERLAKYKKPPMNINALLGKKDNNIPFDNKPVTPQTVQQAKDNNQPFVQSKKPPLIKNRNKVSDVKAVPSTGVKTAKDFIQEFGKDELEKQSLEKENNVAPIDNSLYAKNILNHKDEIVKDKTKELDLPFAQSKPITMEFDNPYEANAIAYKKLKNASVMSPYKGSVNLQSPELYQESIIPYVNNIREQRNAVLQQLNPNSTSGQSVLANIYGQGMAQENEAVSNVGRNNAKFTTDWLAQKAETRNRQQQLDYDMNNKYSADVAQLQATQDENDINYMNSISEMNAKRLQAKNAMVRTAMETGIGDALDIKDNSFTFDVNKLPRNFYSKETNPDNTGTKRQLGKIINVKGVPYESYLDENGKAVMRKVEVQQVGGKTNKYKIFLNNK